MTFLGVIVGAGAVALVVAGWRKALLAVAGFTFLGLIDLWERSLQTLALMLIAVAVCVVIGIPLGIWSGRNPKVEKVLRPLLDTAQTLPAYVYLLPLVIFFSIGVATALIATVIFALPPLVRLTSYGIRGVPSSSLEVGTAFGATTKQVLRKIQVPAREPSIMLGVNQALLMAFGMVVIAAIVGVENLGREVLERSATPGRRCRAERRDRDRRPGHRARPGERGVEHPRPRHEGSGGGACSDGRSRGGSSWRWRSPRRSPRCWSAGTCSSSRTSRAAPGSTW